MLFVPVAVKDRRYKRINMRCNKKVSKFICSGDLRSPPSMAQVVIIYQSYYVLGLT